MSNSQHVYSLRNGVSFFFFQLQLTFLFSFVFSPVYFSFLFSRFSLISNRCRRILINNQQNKQNTADKKQKICWTFETCTSTILFIYLFVIARRQFAHYYIICKHKHYMYIIDVAIPTYYSQMESTFFVNQLIRIDHNNRFVEYSRKKASHKN